MNVEVGFYGLAALGILLLLRLPVAIALISVSFFGVSAMIGTKAAFGVLTNTPYSFVASWTMSAVPMFLLMGFIAYHTGLTSGLFDAAKVLLRRLPGGLAISSIFASTGFAAVSGSSLANAATMGRIAIPEMVAAGYRPSVASGCIAAGGTIGALIPPSILMIVYGVFAETSVTQVFIGGISIGIITGIGYSLVVLLIAWFRPDIIPRHAATDTGADKSALIKVLPILGLIAVVFGGLFTGLFTATEAGAVGALATIVLSLINRTLTIKALRDSLLETVTTTGSLFIIGVGAVMFTRFLGVSGVSNYISGFVSGNEMGYLQLMIVIVLIYLALGTFMEPFGAMLVTLPIFLPILRDMDISLVWFGVLVVKLLEIGMITPPVGMNVFVIKNVASRFVTLAQIFRGVIPFLIADLVIVVLIVAVPSVVMFLPDMMK